LKKKNVVLQKKCKMDLTLTEPVPFERSNFANLRRRNLERLSLTPSPRLSQSPSPIPPDSARSAPSPSRDEYPVLGSPRSRETSPVWNKDKKEIIKMVTTFQPIEPIAEEVYKPVSPVRYQKISRLPVKKIDIELSTSESESNEEIEDIQNSEESEEEYDEETRYSGRLTRNRGRRSQEFLE